MPPKRFRNKNKNKHKNNHPPQNCTPTRNPNHNQKSSSNYVPYDQNQRNRGRSRSRSQSLRPLQKPHTSKHTLPKNTPRPSRPSFSEAQTSPASSGDSLASKATHTLRTSLITAASGVCKRRISLGLSLTLPTSAASQRLKALLIRAVEDARDCIVKMDFSCGSSAPVNLSAEVPVAVGQDDDLGASADAAPDGATETGWRDSGIAMDTDAPLPTAADGWDDVDDEDKTVVAKDEDHGCVDLVREHGQLVQRMRWQSSEFSSVGCGNNLSISSWSLPPGPIAPRKMS